ncbi:R-spondin-2 isoform X2 [Lingula anatina]|uniref:R-spondin-2 isoform X2 n=1 Tax=Lingula anatina TaxID=7574 RepID=A0A1S3KDW1_LINAN|nr:R-spondin-2 isoform X2 [Lingula anatina]|eukprot:XP_013420813.1 R-spondin-2 isoform X2 [Lingula anatina]
MRLVNLLTLTFILTYLSKLTGIRGAPERGKRTIKGVYPLCPHGCTSCSAVNGCVTCRPKMFMLLQRNGMRQTGVCVHACPNGYYGVRTRSLSQCHRCKIENCDSCFNRHYCTSCRAPYIAYRGQCLESCPNGLHYANYSKECLESIDCMVGPWGSWGTCMKKEQTCGYKYGTESRSREILQLPINGVPCQALLESRKCRMKRRHCNTDLLSNSSEPSEEKSKDHIGKKRKRKNKNKKRKRKRGRDDRFKCRRRQRREKERREREQRRRRERAERRRRKQFLREREQSLKSVWQNTTNTFNSTMYIPRPTT